MKIIVCSLAEVNSALIDQGVTHLLSVVDHPTHLNEISCDFDENHWLKIFCEDHIDSWQLHAMTWDQMEKILDWSSDLDETVTLLVHCHAGVSRSPAVALAIMVQQLGANRVADAMKWLKRIKNICCPNPVITNLADQILNCQGKLFKAAEKLASQHLIKKFG
jgi:predicted protein tyrosine phosphatase